MSDLGTTPGSDPVPAVSSSLTPDAADYTLLLNRFKLMHLVQRVAHADVMELVDTVGLDALSYKSVRLPSPSHVRELSQRNGFAHREPPDGGGFRDRHRGRHQPPRLNARRAFGAAAARTDPARSRTQERTGARNSRAVYQPRRTNDDLRAEVAAAAALSDGTDTATAPYYRRTARRAPRRTRAEQEAYAAKLAEPRHRLGADEGFADADASVSAGGKAGDLLDSAEGRRLFEEFLRTRYPGVAPPSLDQPGADRGRAVSTRQYSPPSRLEGRSAEEAVAAPPWRRLHPYANELLPLAGSSHSADAARVRMNAAVQTWPPFAVGTDGANEDSGAGAVPLDGPPESSHSSPNSLQRTAHRSGGPVRMELSPTMKQPSRAHGTMDPQTAMSNADGALVGSDPSAYMTATLAAPMGQSSASMSASTGRDQVLAASSDYRERRAPANCQPAQADSFGQRRQPPQQPRYENEDSLADDSRSDALRVSNPPVPRLAFADLREELLAGRVPTAPSPSSAANSMGSGSGHFLQSSTHAAFDGSAPPPALASLGDASGSSGQSMRVQTTGSAASGAPRSGGGTPRVLMGSRGLAPKAKPKGALDSPRLPMDVVQHAAGVLARQQHVGRSQTETDFVADGGGPGAHGAGQEAAAAANAALPRAASYNGMPAHRQHGDNEGRSPRGILFSRVSPSNLPTADAVALAPHAALSPSLPLSPHQQQQQQQPQAQQPRPPPASLQLIAQSIDQMLHDHQRILEEVVHTQDGEKARGRATAPSRHDGLGKRTGDSGAVDGDGSGESAAVPSSSAAEAEEVEEEESEDEMLVFARLSRRINAMDREMEQIQVSAIAAPSVAPDDELYEDDQETPDTPSQKASDRHGKRSGGTVRAPPRPAKRRHRGSIPQAVVRRILSYQVEQQECIAYAEKQWNTSTASQYTFAQRLTNALLEDCLEEVNEEMSGIMDEYVDGLVDHELQ